jgi:uncharacterized protein YktA (UPF0223 family)
MKDFDLSSWYTEEMSDIKEFTDMIIASALQENHSTDHVTDNYKKFKSVER